VALTHDPKIDDPALLHALSRDCFYIEALGSRKTHGRRVDRLKAAGMAEPAIARIRAPIGLAIGAVSPAEIAISIMAEITATLRLAPERPVAPPPSAALALATPRRAAETAG
jgi:xanthine dehydrogenase accessory factor